MLKRGKWLYISILHETVCDMANKDLVSHDYRVIREEDEGKGQKKWSLARLQPLLTLNLIL